MIIYIVLIFIYISFLKWESRDYQILMERSINMELVTGFYNIQYTIFHQIFKLRIPNLVILFCSAQVSEIWSDNKRMYWRIVKNWLVNIFQNFTLNTFFPVKFYRFSQFSWFYVLNWSEFYYTFISIDLILIIVML